MSTTTADAPERPLAVAFVSAVLLVTALFALTETVAATARDHGENTGGLPLV